MKIMSYKIYKPKTSAYKKVFFSFKTAMACALKPYNAKRKPSNIDIANRKDFTNKAKEILEEELLFIPQELEQKLNSLIYKLNMFSFLELKQDTNEKDLLELKTEYSIQYFS
ncbi:hypothetical protein KAW80_01895 [Candidatus Babeliales bacterium]|nr:hypothetical protein [Candidatus Babeliales bacterium]